MPPRVTRNKKKSFFERYHQQLLLVASIGAVIVLFYLLQLIEQSNRKFIHPNQGAVQNSFPVGNARINSTLLSIRNALRSDNPILLYHAVRSLLLLEGNTSRSLYYQFRGYSDVNDVAHGLDFLQAVLIIFLSPFHFSLS